MWGSLSFSSPWWTKICEVAGNVECDKKAVMKYILCRRSVRGLPPLLPGVHLLLFCTRVVSQTRHTLPANNYALTGRCKDPSVGRVALSSSRPASRPRSLSDWKPRAACRLDYLTPQSCQIRPFLLHIGRTEKQCRIGGVILLSHNVCWTVAGIVVGSGGNVWVRFVWWMSKDRCITDELLNQSEDRLACQTWATMDLLRREPNEHARQKTTTRGNRIVANCPVADHSVRCWTLPRLLFDGSFLKLCCISGDTKEFLICCVAWFMNNLSCNCTTHATRQNWEVGLGNAWFGHTEFEISL